MQSYSFDILRPIQAEILRRGHQVAWFIAGSEVTEKQLKPDEIRLKTVAEVKAFNPIAVFVPGNIVPDFFPGAKVQVFHGLEYKKQGHFDIRGFFDLYCILLSLFCLCISIGISICFDKYGLKL